MKKKIIYDYMYILKGLFLLIVITFICYLFGEHLQIMNIALIHILPILVVAIHGNLKSTFFITLLSVTLLSFLYIPPLYSIDVNDELYIWSFVIFAIVGWIITIQAKNLHTQTKQNELKESLLNIISHDLRTPLSTIHGTVNLLLSDKKKDEKTTQDLLEDINYSSLRMKRLITNIFDSTRLANKDLNIKLEWCDFEDIIGVALEEFPQRESQDLIDIKIDNMTLYLGDNTLLTQLIVNLLDNAFKYSKLNTVIKLEIRNLVNFIRITIFNESENVDSIKISNIFDKFYRVEDLNDISGSGIGLSICKSVVQLHNGEIKAVKKDHGISIEINLPVLKRAEIL